MSASPYELAIFGSTPLAGVVAGLLAMRHRKRVALIAETPSPFRLPTGLDLSVMPMTRPESWALLKAATAETLKLLHQLGGRRATRHIDPVFVAETAPSSAALSHMQQMAMAFGYAVERLSARGVEGLAVRVRDAVLVDRQMLAPLLANWLDHAGVVRLEARQSNAVFNRDGSVRIDHAGQTIEAARAVLADDEAIAAWLDPGDGKPGQLMKLDATAMLIAAKRAQAEPFVHHLDRGVTLLQRPDAQVFALSAGRANEAARRVGSCFADRGPAKRLAQREFRIVATADGAPLAGALEGSTTSGLAGFGSTGLFLAPALARHLAGLPSASEAAYFAARQAGPEARSVVAEYAAAAAFEWQS